MRIVRAYWLMLRFDFLSNRAWLPMWLGVQMVLAVGASLMYGFYLPKLTPGAAAFIVTGSPTLALVPIGLVMLPFGVNMQRAARTFDFLWSLPVPRPVSVAATLTVFTLVSLPGIVVTLILASLRYDVELHVSPSIVPAVLLCSLMAASVGLGIAHGIRSALIGGLITNLLMFVALMFSPIAMPIEQFPAWLADLHRVLPLYHMAVVIRAGLTTGLVSDVGASYLILTAWTLGGLAAAGWVIGRRG